MTVAATHKIQRWFDHAEMKRTCRMFSIPGSSKQFAAVLGAPVTEDLQLVAQAFIRFQDARHEADYDLSSTWTRLTAQQYVKVARDAFYAWAQLRRSHEANVFALALLSAKIFEKER